MRLLVAFALKIHLLLKFLLEPQIKLTSTSAAVWIQQIRFDHRDLEIGRGALKCAPGRGRKEGGDLPRGTVIAVSQHLNEGRIGRSHGHGGEGRTRSGSPWTSLHPPLFLPPIPFKSGAPEH